MWKINQCKKNQATLDKFNKDVVQPIRMALNNETSAKAIAALPNFSIYRRPIEFKVNAKVFRKSITELIIEWYSIEKRKKINLEKIYLEACKDLSNKILPKKQKIDLPIKHIFSKITYALLFDPEALKEIGIYNFTRDVYLTNIIKLCGQYVCPYCDASTLILECAHVEHFLSRNSYPLLATNPENLLVACETCNRNKMSGLPNNYNSPFLMQHGDAIDFDLSNGITLDTNDDSTLDFLNVTKIQKIYTRNAALIIPRVTGEIEYLCQAPILSKRDERTTPFFFLRRNLVRKILDSKSLEPQARNPFI
jgi:5-methylcytosine-specific restriction endonuclease McrA